MSELTAPPGYAASNGLYRENLPHTRGGATFSLPAYGYAEGLIVKFDHPLPNMNYPAPIKVELTVRDENGEEVGLTLQGVFRAVSDPYNEFDWNDGSFYAGHPELTFDRGDLG